MWRDTEKFKTSSLTSPDHPMARSPDSLLGPRIKSLYSLSSPMSYPLITNGTARILWVRRYLSGDRYSPFHSPPSRHLLALDHHLRQWPWRLHIPLRGDAP